MEFRSRTFPRSASRRPLSVGRLRYRHTPVAMRPKHPLSGSDPYGSRLPHTPCTELGSGENAWTVAGVAELEDVVLLAAVFFLEPPEEQAARISPATTGSTMNRFMETRPYL